MSKTRLIEATKISTNAMVKMRKNQYVRIELLVKKCVLNYMIDNFMEITSTFAKIEE